MSAIERNETERDFDLVRLTKAKAAVDVCSNTLRAYNREGLRFYKCGKAVFFSKRELAEFIRTRSRMAPAPVRGIAKEVVS